MVVVYWEQVIFAVEEDMAEFSVADIGFFPFSPQPFLFM